MSENSPSLSEATTFSVLVAEDNPVNRQVIRLLFQRLEVPVEFASDGRDAVDLFALRRHPLVLMDIHMQRMDGLDAARLIRSSAAASHQPVIVAFTARSGESHIDYTALGFNDVIEKPLKPAALKMILEKYLPQYTPAPEESLQTAAPVPDPDLPGPALFDEGVLGEMRACLGDDSREVVASLIDIYLNHTPDLLAQMEQSLENGDRASVHRAAHTLKSSSANMGLMRLSALAEELELVLKPMLINGPDSQDVGKIKNNITGKRKLIQTAFSRAVSALGAYQARLNSNP